MCSATPLWPTATQSSALAQLTASSCLVLLPPVATWLVQRAPPSPVVRIVPWSPTAAQKLVLVQLTARSVPLEHPLADTQLSNAA